ncbi:IS30 family transposase [Mycoplasma hafezii]|uniref:IS30 family transposase n=1 Tax=Mycoplasma hafezii TaxID=525886 RepID=UPI003CEDF5D5
MNDRSDFGYYEIDLIIGRKEKQRDHLITFVERKTRHLFIVRINGKNGWLINLKIWDLIKKYKLNVKSITCDNGFEFNKLFYLSYRTGITIYKTDPYASFQKGTNENTNGLIRRYFPKGTDFGKVSDNYLLYVQNRINLMPREILGWYLASELFMTWNDFKEPWKIIPLD